MHKAVEFMVLMAKHLIRHLVILVAIVLMDVVAQVLRDQMILQLAWLAVIHTIMEIQTEIPIARDSE